MDPAAFPCNVAVIVGARSPGATAEIFEIRKCYTVIQPNSYYLSKNLQKFKNEIFKNFKMINNHIYTDVHG